LAHYLTGGRGDSLVVGGAERHVVSYMKDFLFEPDQARTPVRSLSGGEKARLVLARILAQPANLLVLDEPTNDLDMETLDLLQELVAGFPGTVLLVSHDRDFLDRTVTSTVVPEGDGRWTVYAGGYSDMLAQRGAAQLEPATRQRGRERPSREAEPSGGRQGDEPRRKLSYKQKYALETIPGEIEKLSAEIEKLELQLSDPGFYDRDPEGFARTAEELDRKRDRRARMEEEWLELEML